jgi:hypothetical protein
MTKCHTLDTNKNLSGERLKSSAGPNKMKKKYIPGKHKLLPVPVLRGDGSIFL